MNCEKSDKIVRNFADYLAETDKPGWGAALFMLSTGEKKDLEVVRRWFSGKLSTDNPRFPWSFGYSGPAVCEYYLRTGDESVLPAIQSRCDYLRNTIYNGSWMGRGGANFNYMAGGHMNAASVHCVTFLLMAKECGVNVDERTLQTSLQQFYKYAGHGNVPYGDQFPEGGFTDNGRVGKLAFAMQAAANLIPDGENSVCAKARDISATKSFYSTSWLFHGHTGGGIGELWRGSAMGLVKDKRPKQYRSFMDERRWMYELARTHEGSFAWPAGFNVNYTKGNTGRPCGNYIPLVYTLPRKQLRIFGAPPTQYSQTYKLPERPWGTPADDAFYSLKAGEYAPGKRLDVSKEKIRNGASRAIFARIKSPDVTEETLLKYALHIDQGIRASAMGQIKKRSMDHLILKLLKSKNPRGRHSGVLGVDGLPKPLSKEVVTLLTGMVADSDESWWVVQEALKALSNASADQLAPHMETLEKWLAHDDWWLKAGALQAMSRLVADKRFYKRLIPQIAKVMANNQRPGMHGYFNHIVDSIKNADATAQSFAAKQFSKAYARYPERISAPGGQDMTAGTNYMLQHVATFLAKTPGGFDELYEVSKERFPDKSLPHKELYLQADADRIGPKLQKSMKQLILEELIPEYIGKGHHPQSNRGYLINEATSAEPLQWGFYYRRPRMAELVNLYQRAGIHKYDWQDFGPEWTDMAWHCLSFDPPEKKLPGTGTRYREVTLPEDMENWYKPRFDPKQAGWKTGKQPFGQLNGKLVTDRHECRYDFCRCGEPIHTLWKNEVMLVRHTFDFPKFKEGHRYRLLVGGMSHVNAGDGFRIYVNGELMKERKRGVGKREGAQPLAYYIDKAWWPDFNDGETTIATISFLDIEQNTTKRHFSIWL